MTKIKTNNTMKVISYQESFELVVDLFPVDYNGGESAIDSFSESLTHNGFIFTRQPGKRRHRFLIVVNAESIEQVNRMLNDIPTA